MNLKSKLFGFSAAAALALSMTAGAMANPVTLDLDYSDCGTHALTGGNFSLGTGKWTGTAYDGLVAGTGTLTVNGAEDGTDIPDTCDVGLALTELEEMNSLETIPVTAFALTVDLAGATYSAGQFNVAGLAAGGTEYDLSLSVIIPADTAAGSYNGELTVSSYAGV